MNMFENREALNRENEQMIKRLERRKASKATSETEKNQNLAKLAGISIPKGTSGLSSAESRRRPSKANKGRDRVKVGGMESTSREGKRGRILLSRSRSRSPRRRRRKSQRSEKESHPRSPDQWRHDKFSESLRSPKKRGDETEPSFGSHWNQIRSERSKERDRKNSRSSSRSRRRRRHHRSSSSSSRSYSSASSRSVSSASSEEVRRERRRHKAAREAAELAQQKTGSAKTAETPAAAETSETVNMELSGKLLEDTNTVNGVIVRYAEPPEARKPRTKWRLYVFKGNEELPILYVHRQSSYLLGRDRKVADIPLDHPSCSKQHAVLQYRLVSYKRSDGSQGKKVTPYIVDMNSANGTFLNNQRIEGQKYVELVEKDVLKFGFSSREYVMLHDQSKEDGDDPGVD